MRIGVVGATGLVGQKFLQLLKDFPEPLEEIRLFARSKQKILFKDQELFTQTLSEEGFANLDLCFFSAGSDVSKKWAPASLKARNIVVDNSSAFRGDQKILLIVPEVNGGLLEYKPQIISNPNCSTIQLVVPLKPLHQAFGLKKVRVTSLQSISGAGRQALSSLKQNSQEILEGKQDYASKQGQAFNCQPMIGPITENGFCEEEIKIREESRKILGLPELDISSFTVRVPTLNSHSLVCYLDLEKPPSSKQDIIEKLQGFPGLHVETSQEEPPHGRMASGKKEVFVGRIHQDASSKNSWILWIVADNLLKGASLNSLQITQELMKLKPRRDQ